MPTRAIRGLPARNPATRPSLERSPVFHCGPLFVMAVLSVGILVSCGSCNRYRGDPKATSDQGSLDAQPAVDHGHRGGSMGGVISSIGRDQYHAELVLQEGGVLTLHTLAQDETRIYEVPDQVLTAYVKRPQSGVSVAIVLKPNPLPDDGEQMTSRFTGELPETLVGQSLYITIPGLRIDEERFAVRFQIPHDTGPEMPAPIADEEATALYLTAGGRYTEADIDANGRTTAAKKYAGFRAAHDANPAPGEPICPISRTKAHPQCSWVIGGETYRFCCPPCIDEFLALAKNEVEAKTILPAEEYVQRQPAADASAAAE